MVHVLKALLITILILGCRDTASKKHSSVDQSGDPVSLPSKDSSRGMQSQDIGLKVSAYLIYNDGTLSSFDVLNNKGVALWNVIIGAGDALKPSDSTKVSLHGYLDGLHIKIRNGRERAIDTNITHSDKDVEIIVRNTGCAQVYVNVSRNNKVVYNDTIPFACGE